MNCRELPLQSQPTSSFIHIHVLVRKSARNAVELLFLLQGDFQNHHVRRSFLEKRIMCKVPIPIDMFVKGNLQHLLFSKNRQNAVLQSTPKKGQKTTNEFEMMCQGVFLLWRTCCIEYLSLRPSGICEELIPTLWRGNCPTMSK